MLLDLVLNTSYLWWTPEVHSWNRQSSNVHGDTAVQVQRPHNEQEPPANNWPVNRMHVGSKSSAVKMMKNHCIISQNTYLCFMRLHWMIHKITSIIPFISHTENAHSTLLNKSKNLSGKGGVASLGGTRSWTIEIMIVVKTKQQMAYNKATQVFPHSVGNCGPVGSGTVIRTSSLWKPFTEWWWKPFGLVLPEAPASRLWDKTMWLLAKLFLCSSIWCSMLSALIFSRKCLPPSRAIWDRGGFWKSVWR